MAQSSVSPCWKPKVHCSCPITWPVSRGSKMTTYLEFLWRYCLFTVQLLWGYDDD